jgi:hypothetical protein
MAKNTYEFIDRSRRSSGKLNVHAFCKKNHSLSISYILRKLKNTKYGRQGFPY